MEFLPIMTRKQLSEGGLLINSMRDFRNSLLAWNIGITFSVEDDKKVLLTRSIGIPYPPLLD